MDELRSNDFKGQHETKYLRERLKYFEGTSVSGFKGFSGAQNAMNSNNPTLMTQNNGNQEFKLVQVN